MTAKQGISPNDFLAAKQEFAEKRRTADRANAQARTVRQRMEKLGCDMPAFDLAERLMTLGAAEAEQRLRNALRYIRWQGMEIGDQAALFEDDTSKPSQKAAQQFSEAQAYNEGYEAGIKGRDRFDSRFPNGTPLAAQFDRGWCDGQEELALQLGTERPADGTLKPGGKAAKGKKGSVAVAGNPRGRGGRRRGAEAVN